MRSQGALFTRCVENDLESHEEREENVKLFKGRPELSLTTGKITRHIRVICTQSVAYTALGSLGHKDNGLLSIDLVLTLPIWPPAATVIVDIAVAYLRSVSAENLKKLYDTHLHVMAYESMHDAV